METRQGERFFFVMGLILFGLVVAGFVPPAISRPGGIASMPWLLHVHAAVFVSWFLLFCTQAWLPGAGNIALHMRLGKASVLLAIAMVVLGYFVMRGAYANPAFSIAGMSSTASMMFPFTDMVNFSTVYLLALAHRNNPTAHKRLMLLAGILIIDPAVARLIFFTLEAPPPLIMMLELGLLATMIVYHFTTLRRLSWATIVGLILFVLALVGKFAVAQTPAWQSFVVTVFG